MEPRAHARIAPALGGHQSAPGPLRLHVARQIHRPDFREALAAHACHLRCRHPEHGRLRGFSRPHAGVGFSWRARVHRRCCAQPRALGAWHLGARLGVHLRIATPPDYAPAPEVVADGKRVARETRAKIELLTDPREAVSGAMGVYTDAWTSMGFEAEEK